MALRIVILFSLFLDSAGFFTGFNPDFRPKSSFYSAADTENAGIPENLTGSYVELGAPQLQEIPIGGLHPPAEEGPDNFQKLRNFRMGF